MTAVTTKITSPKGVEGPKIYPAICSIIGDIGAIAKNKKNQKQGFMYRGIDDVMNALQPMLAKYHVFVVPTVLEQYREDGTTKAGGVSHLSIFKIKYTFYAEDGSFIESVTVGESADTGDKGSNKAMAIAFKYALFQVFCIPTEEMPDPDAETPPEMEKKPKATPKPSTKTAPVPPQPVISEKKMIESEITNLIFPNATKDGRGEPDDKMVSMYRMHMWKYIEDNPEIEQLCDLTIEQMKIMKWDMLGIPEALRG
jgi:hypothetical protein